MTIAPPNVSDIILRDLMASAESRQLTDDELDRYQAQTGRADLAATARAVRDVELAVVTEVIEEIFDLYPFADLQGGLSHAKCIRDVRYASAYATMAMLRQDMRWLDDKFLLWNRTILQSFDFPDRRKKATVLFADTTSSVLDRLPKNVRSIYDTYTRLRDGFQDRLEPAVYRHIEPYLQRVVDVLTS